MIPKLKVFWRKVDSKQRNRFHPFYLLRPSLTGLPKFSSCLSMGALKVVKKVRKYEFETTPMNKVIITIIRETESRPSEIELVYILAQWWRWLFWKDLKTWDALSGKKRNRMVPLCAQWGNARCMWWCRNDLKQRFTIYSIVWMIYIVLKQFTVAV